ncbi:SpoIIE family protein phosphatase [Streptomyces formicae]|uniref:SpoIIE family protein phosphatase n=1 Tax=Streptomyces formicae TaxID=1616117 RepID=A0ABY3WQT3_9ACTN|nr:SpoIIE family protein phosphatase [Streptomyces formicae]UNM13672.1 SpoIIE family protein phosphatase [Streptomyces formicae]
MLGSVLRVVAADHAGGLIERRGGDIDTGLERLIDSLTRHCDLDLEGLASALLVDVRPTDDGPDDATVLVVVRL